MNSPIDHEAEFFAEVAKLGRTPRAKSYFAGRELLTIQDEERKPERTHESWTLNSGRYTE